MRLLRLTLVFVTLALTASATDVDGTWKVVFTSPIDERPKMVSEMVFKITTSGGRLTGTAHMANWPGHAPISDGTINGHRVTFTALGKHPWWSNCSSGSASGLPKLMFSGTVQGKEIQLTLVWDNVMIYGDSVPPGRYEMKGWRISD